ncbi:acyltransferase [Pseudaeromonas sp. ZJS20]|uniref:acyltransferase family protein n=1 Tax=Pseudaeromonas aegiceratis TaxID=3153928 RepID=UPI00390C4CC9
MTKDKIETIPALDGIRGAACLLVVLSHVAEYLPNSSKIFSFPIALGSPGVAIFFLLSGYLMSYLYLGKPFDIKTSCGYVISRFSRIAPAYWIAILMSVAIYVFVDGEFPAGVPPHEMLRHLLFIGGKGVFWSIPPEVQYYVFFLGVWFAADKLRVKVYWPLVLVLVLVVFMWFTRERWPGILLPSKFHFFISGCLAAIVFDQVRWRFAPTMLLVTLAQLMSIVAISFGISGLRGVASHEFYNSSWFFLIVFFFIIAFCFRSQFADGLFGNKLMRWFGRVSFSVYLFHCPVLYGAAWMLSQFDLVGVGYDMMGIFFAILVPGLFSLWIELPLCRVFKTWLNRHLKDFFLLREKQKVSVEM